MGLLFHFRQQLAWIYHHSGSGSYHKRVLPGSFRSVRVCDEQAFWDTSLVKCRHLLPER